MVKFDVERQMESARERERETSERGRERERYYCRSDVHVWGGYD